MYSNTNYRLLASIPVPRHSGDNERATILHIYDVSEGKMEELENLNDTGCIKELYETIREDLDLVDDYNVLPGARYTKYTVVPYLWEHLISVYETIAYNV